MSPTPTTTTTPPASLLSADSLDDLIYFARTGSLSDLRSDLTSLASTHSTTVDKILGAAIDNLDPSASSGCSLLHWAAANGHVDVLGYLLSSIDDNSSEQLAGDGVLLKPRKGGLVNFQNTSGNTALHWAALNGNLECVKMLVKKGADPAIRNAAGMDAVFEAERGEVNRRGGEDEEVDVDAEGKNEDEDEKREIGVVDWLLENCEGLDKGLGGGETVEGAQSGEGNMDVDG